jgi:hypothetical protein
MDQGKQAKLKIDAEQAVEIADALEAIAQSDEYLAAQAAIDADDTPENRAVCWQILARELVAKGMYIERPF